MNIKPTLLLLISCLLASLAYGQQKQPVDFFELTKPYTNKMDFYTGLQELKKHEVTDTADLMNLNVYYQALATLYAFNGMTDSAIIAMDRAYTKGVLVEKPKNADTVNLLGYAAQDAKTYILNNIADRQVLMVNEAHHIPQHRVFVKSLLQDLYTEGFRYLCLEAVYYDSAWLYTLDPFSPSLVTHSGYYTKEACFAELVREAIRVGYVIYGYEPNDFTNNAERDSLMAENLYELIDGNPKAKLLVLGGYGHFSKTLRRSAYSYLKQLYGIAAFTVDQTVFYEHSTPHYESPYYIAYTNTFSISTPSVLVDSLGNIVSPNRKNADVYVYAPRVSYVNGRPDWLFEGGKRTPLTVRPSKKTKFLKAYYANEVAIKGKELDTFYVPVDQLVVQKSLSTAGYTLLLPQGLFLIQHIDGQGNILKEYYKQVK